MQLLKETFRQRAQLSESDLEHILGSFAERPLAAGETWLEQGKHCHELGFVRDGMLRYHYLNPKGEDTTCYFAKAGEFATSFKAFSTNSLLTESVEAIIPSTLYVIERTALFGLYQQIPALQEFGRQEVERVAMRMENRIAMLQILSAEERYEHLATQRPELLQYVPVQYLASYMGITRQHLARLRKKK